jgi:hypothetical protein
LGSLHQLTRSGASWLTYCDVIAPQGVMEPGGQRVFPMYHVFADIGEYVGGNVLAISLREPLKIEAFALRRDRNLRVMVANLTNLLQKISVVVPSYEYANIRVLNEYTYERATTDRHAFRRDVHHRISGPSSSLDLKMDPFAFLCVDLIIN